MRIGVESNIVVEMLKVFSKLPEELHIGIKRPLPMLPLPGKPCYQYCNSVLHTDYLLASMPRYLGCPKRI